MLHIPNEDRVLCFTPTPVLLTESVRFQTIYEDLSTHLEKILPDFRYQIHELTLSLNVEIKL